MSYQNIAKAKAIEKNNRQRLLKINPQLDDKSGIYFLTRVDENDIEEFDLHDLLELYGCRVVVQKEFEE